MEKLDAEGRIVYSKNGVPRYKIYADEGKGRPLQDLWTDIPAIHQSVGKEKLGYPTQKPEALLERIIKSSSNPTDIVLDPFCGCGTAIAVAQKLGRQWVGIDVSPTACSLMEQRMRALRVAPHVVGMPMSALDLGKLVPFEFQNWVVKRLMGRASSRKTSDMGIDGYTFEGHPIQVKQQEEVGRNVIDNFETAMRRSKKDIGVIVAFSFERGAYEEIARAKLHDKLSIKALTVAELLQIKRELPDFTA